MSYTAPLKDMVFVMNELAGLDTISQLPGCEDVNAELVEQILEENGRFATEVLSPLNKSGDTEGSVLKDGKVTTPKGFKDAYKAYAEAGWVGLAAGNEFGGSGMPPLIVMALNEIQWYAWPTGNAASRHWTPTY